MKWIDKLPVFPLAVVAVFMAVLPLHSTPHLVEKLNMLQSGTLSRPIDIFDLFMHGTPTALLAIRLFREFVMGIKAEDEDESADQESDKK